MGCEPDQLFAITSDTRSRTWPPTTCSSFTTPDSTYDTNRSNVKGTSLLMRYDLLEQAAYEKQIGHPTGDSTICDLLARHD
jgi:hypothetical protein